MQFLMTRPKNADLNLQLKEKHGLTDVQMQALFLILWSVAYKDIAPAEVLNRVQTDARLDPAKAKSVTANFLSWRVLPFEWHVGPVQPAITAAGGNAVSALAEARKNYPEAYDPNFTLDQPRFDFPDLPEKFDEWMKDEPGRNEILLRLTNLAAQLSKAISFEEISEADGQAMIKTLDDISAAINTKELNALEIAAYKRKLSSLIDEILERDL